MSAAKTLKSFYLTNSASQLVQFSSVSQSCPTLCNPMDGRSQASPSITNCQSLLSSCPRSCWCHPTISSSVIPFSSHLQSFPASGSLPVSQFFTSGGQSLEFQLQHQTFKWIFRTDSFRIDWLDLIAVQGTLMSLLQQHSSKAAILQRSSFFQISFPFMSNYHFHSWLWKNHSFD